MCSKQQYKVGFIFEMEKIEYEYIYGHDQTLTASCPSLPFSKCPLIAKQLLGKTKYTLQSEIM